MRKGLWQWPCWTFALIVACDTSGAAWAQTDRLPATTSQPYAVSAPVQSASGPLSFDDIRTQFDRQQAEIERLQAQLASLSQSPQIIPVGDQPAQGDAAAKAAEDAKKAAEPYQVGSDMSIKARFFNGAGVMFETPNKDFTMHLGGWFQWDNVWWNSSAGMATLPTAQAANQGVASGGIGPL
jgi:hypothetical protein